MTTKDYRVVCAIIVKIADYLRLDTTAQEIIFYEVRDFLQESYDKFDPEFFDKLYDSELNDIGVAKEEEDDDDDFGDAPLPSFLTGGRAQKTDPVYKNTPMKEVQQLIINTPVNNLALVDKASQPVNELPQAEAP